MQNIDCIDKENRLSFYYTSAWIVIVSMWGKQLLKQNILKYSRLNLVNSLAITCSGWVRTAVGHIARPVRTLRAHGLTSLPVPTGHTTLGAVYSIEAGEAL